MPTVEAVDHSHVDSRVRGSLSGTSLLVRLFWLYFALPFIGVELPKMLVAILAIGLNFGAYGSEIVRAPCWPFRKDNGKPL